MKTRISLLALALAVPFAGCETDDPAVEDVDVVTTEDAVLEDDVMTDDTMMDDAMPADPVTAESTLEAVPVDGLTAMAPGAAVANIDNWIAQLEGNPDFAPTVEGLQTLKTQLTTDPLDGAAIGQTLVMLGEQTKAAAGGDGALEQLGEALENAGTQLSGE